MPATLPAGWAPAPRRTTRAAGADRRHAVFHRRFASAAWSIAWVGLALFELVAAGAGVVFLAMDDVLLLRRGLRVVGVGEAPLSGRGHTAFAWGRCRVVLSVVVEIQYAPGQRLVTRTAVDRAAARFRL